MSACDSWKDLVSKAECHGFIVVGGAPAVWRGAGHTVALLGLDEAGWRRFRASPEAADGAPDPLDRWSKRVAGDLAAALGVEAVFPSDGPPYPPFYAWAQAAGVSASPARMLVHPSLGLWVSFRAALLAPPSLKPPQVAPVDCAACAKPCLTECPVAALKPERYDVETCAAHLRTPEGRRCRDHGCLARHACPVGADAAPSADRAAFHLAAFLRNR